MFTFAENCLSEGKTTIYGQLLSKAFINQRKEEVTGHLIKKIYYYAYTSNQRVVSSRWLEFKFLGTISTGDTLAWWAHDLDRQILFSWSSRENNSISHHRRLHFCWGNKNGQPRSSKKNMFQWTEDASPGLKGKHSRRPAPDRRLWWLHYNRVLVHCCFWDPGRAPWRRTNQVCLRKPADKLASGLYNYELWRSQPRCMFPKALVQGSDGVGMWEVPCPKALLHKAT